MALFVSILETIKEFFFFLKTPPETQRPLSIQIQMGFFELLSLYILNHRSTNRFLAKWYLKQ